MAPYFLARSDSADASPIPISKTVYIVGFTLAGFFLALAASWVALRFFRRKLQEKRAEARGAAFLNVRGVVRETDERVNFMLSAQSTNHVIFPNRAVVPRTPRIVVPSRHDDDPSLPQIHPASPSPSSRSRALSGLNPAHPRHSHASSARSPSSPHFPPGLHSRDSSRSSSSSQARPVRQIFQPVLPDELALSRVGEHLIVLQSFDDGWCLAARDNSRNSRSSFSLFNPSRLSSRLENSGESAGLGFVPAWVFIKPTKGMRVERPIRSSSAGLLQPGSHAPDSRHSAISAISWANFNC